jgi:hypothetical protein
LTVDPLIARLAAANPAPLPLPARARPPRRRRRLTIAVALAAVAIGVPALAFADSIGSLLGISNQGTTVAADDTPFVNDPDLYGAMHQLGLSTMQLLGQREGFSFYAARDPQGQFCFAVDGPATRGIGCRLDDAFPSDQDPLIDLFSTPQHIAGFAADDVADIALLDASGDTIATIPVSGNIYALADPPPGGTEVEALDASGNVIASHNIPQGP